MIHACHILPDYDISGGAVSAALSVAKTQSQNTKMNVFFSGSIQKGHPAKAFTNFRTHTTKQYNFPFGNKHSNQINEYKNLFVKFNAIHIHGIWEPNLLAAIIAAKQCGIQTVISPHGMLTKWSLSQNKLIKKIYTKIFWNNNKAAMHFASKVEQENSLQLCRKYAVIPFAPDLKCFKPNIEKKTNDPKIIFTGRIIKGKRVDILIKSIKHLKSINAQLIIVSPDAKKKKNQIFQLARKFGVQKRIHVIGPLTHSELSQKLQESTIFAISSIHENYSMATLEAMASGTPVVATRQVAIAHEAASHSNGALICPATPKGFAKACDEIIQNQNLYQNLRSNALKFIQTELNPDAINRKWLNLYLTPRNNCT